MALAAIVILCLACGGNESTPSTTVTAPEPSTSPQPQQSEGGDTDERGDTDTTTAPDDTDTTFVPDGGGEGGETDTTTAPADTDTTFVPDGGGEGGETDTTTAPDDTDTTFVPDGGGEGGETDTTFVPDGGGETDTTFVPDGGGEGGETDTTFVPDGGGEGGETDTTFVPDGGGEGGETDTTFVPEDADTDTSAAPEDADTSAVPEDGDATVAPEDADTSAVPEDGDVTVAPEDADTEDADTEDADTSAVPEDDDTSAVPEDDDTSAVPEDDDTSAVPEDGDTTVAPEDGDTDDTATTGVAAPPADLGVDPFYEKYVDAAGLPIISSARVPDEALLQARRLIEEMLAGRRDVLATLAANNVRVAIMAEGSGITELPELSDLYEAFPGIDWDDRTRGGGAGPTVVRPVLAIAEENLLCYSADRFPYEDIVVHEAAHALLNMGIELQSGGALFRERLERTYRDALDAGLWQSTYAAENADEYWAEGVQSWFDVNDVPGPVHNEINTRSELEEYDPALAALVKEALGDVTLSSSCHSAATDPQTNSKIAGVVRGPDGTAVGGVGLWAWSGEASTSGFATTQSDGTFAITVPDGSFTLDIHANTSETCTFVGWHGPGGFTTMRESVTLIVVDGADVSGIEITLPQQLDDLPFIEWCS